MPLSMYQSSIPIFIHMLGNLRNILQKGATHATAKNFDATILVNSRLAPDMFALARQVQIATDMVKGCAARLASIEPPKYEDTESTIDELIARIDKTIHFLINIFFNFFKFYYSITININYFYLKIRNTKVIKFR